MVFRNRIKALAEKVETGEEYRAARAMGYHWSQGFFLRRPELLRTQDVPTLQVNYFRLPRAVTEPELRFNLIEEVIRAEPGLCLRLLR